jgi:hypothetical protein
MREVEYDEIKYQGNWLGKVRHNITCTRRCWNLIGELCQEFGLSHGGIIELAIREKYIKDIGSLPPIMYHNGRKAGSKNGIK